MSARSTIRPGTFVAWAAVLLAGRGGVWVEGRTRGEFRAAVSPSRPFEKLSQYALFAGEPAAQVPAEGVIPYDLNSALFSDYAEKYRFVKLPAGKPASYHDVDTFDFPVGTVIAKTFAYPRNAPRPVEGPSLDRDAHPQSRARRLGRTAVYLERRPDRGHPRRRGRHR